LRDIDLRHRVEIHPGFQGSRTHRFAPLSANLTSRNGNPNSAIRASNAIPAVLVATTHFPEFGLPSNSR
jgi:hypothetical protein